MTLLVAMGFEFLDMKNFATYSPILHGAFKITEPLGSSSSTASCLHGILEKDE